MSRPRSYIQAVYLRWLASADGPAPSVATFDGEREALAWLARQDVPEAELRRVIETDRAAVACDTRRVRRGEDY